MFCKDWAWYDKNFVCLNNARQNNWNKVKKFSKSEQN